MVAAAVCGLMFGWGLLVSGMVQPGKVLGFLDIFGSWDPSLAVVMVAALAVSSLGFRFAASRKHPILAAECIWPTRTGIDRPLVVGAAMFGIGWGLVGLCPGPALENLATLSPRWRPLSWRWPSAWFCSASGQGSTPAPNNMKRRAQSLSMAEEQQSPISRALDEGR